MAGISRGSCSFPMETAAKSYIVCIPPVATDPQSEVKDVKLARAQLYFYILCAKH